MLQCIIPLFISIVFISCASISPVSQKRERPASFFQIEDVIPQWQNYAEGIIYFHGQIEKPKLEFYALQIDLSSPEIQIFVSAGTGRVTSFVRDNGLIAGINANPFNADSRNIGIVISDGELLSPADPRLYALVFFKDGSAAIVSQSDLETDNIQNAVGGFLQILENGESPERVQQITSQRPRSAAGICSDGNFLILLAVTGNVGATQTETALLLRSLGSENGINFDGGGSSSLALRFPDGRVRSVNTRFERVVAGSLGIRMQD